MIQHSKHQQPADSYYIDPALWTRGRNVIVFIALVSWLISIAGLFSNPQRFYESYLVGFLFAVTIPLGALFFVMLQFLTGSAWSVPVRRIAENIMVTVAIGLVLFIPIAFGLNNLYSWMDQALVAKDAVLKQKAGYLSMQWFLFRAAFYFLVWGVLTNRLYKNSTDQDKNGALKYMHAASRWSAPGLLVTTLTASLAAWDWSMSLDPHWYSTMFGLYVLAGGALSFMATWTLVCLGFREKGVLRNTITVEHYHDLGKWMFALVIFWAYLAFSQYLLIWYANIPEETEWFLVRSKGSWGWVSLLIVFGHFAVPFLVLLPRAAKRNFKVLAVMAAWLLFIQFVDFYWQVMPTFHPAGVAVHWLDVSCAAAIASIFSLVFWFRVKSHALLPVGDPRFEQGLSFENI